MVPRKIRSRQMTNSLPYEKLPSNVEDFRDRRALAASRTLNDIVEEIALTLYRTEKFRKYIDAVYDEQAAEGSLAADNVMAAMMIREEAKRIQRPEAAEQKLATLSKALGVVLRRYRASRKQRRNMMGGEVVPAEENGDKE
jgi:hypothetical protein